MSTKRLFLVALLSLAPAVAMAHGPEGHPADPNLHVDPTLEDCSVIFASNLTQSAFGRFVREFGSTSAFKPMAPPMTLGRHRVSLALEYMSFTVDEKVEAWNNTFHHPDAYHELGTDLSFPKVSARVGVTDKIDVGAFWTRNPNANYGWFGADVKYGLLRQSETMPVSLALRGAYTKTLYVKDMDMHTGTVDVAVGRTFWRVFTPYAGVGSDLVLATERTSAVDLKREVELVPTAHAGLEVRWWHVAIGAQAHQAALANFQMQVSALF